MHTTVNERDADIVVVGGGPNGLTCAAYLARARVRVLVLEKRFEWGGTLASDDYSTPFRWNIAQYALPLGKAELAPVRDLDLTRDGLRFIEPEALVAFVPSGGGSLLSISRDGRELGAELAEPLAVAASLAVSLLYGPPSSLREVENTVAHRQDGKRILALAELTPDGLSRLPDDPRARAVVRYVCGLSGFLADDEPLGLMGILMVALTLRPTLVRGGSKALANALFAAGVKAGGRYLASADVYSVKLSDEAAVVACRDGRRFTARAVVSTLDPRTTFTKLVAPEVVPPALMERAKGWRPEEAAFFTAHFGIKGEAPTIPDGIASPAFMQIVGFSDGDEVADHFCGAVQGKLPLMPAGHLSVTSLHDPSLVSQGPFGPLHALRFQTLVPSRHPEGSWDRARTDYRSRCWSLLSGHLEGLADDRVLFAFADTPEDIERRFRTTRNGSLRHGMLTRDQTFLERPSPDCSDGRTPIPGLYMGGSCIHPGVPGTLAEGYRVAGLSAMTSVCADGGDERGARRSVGAPGVRVY